MRLDRRGKGTTPVVGVPKNTLRKCGRSEVTIPPPNYTLVPFPDGKAGDAEGSYEECIKFLNTSGISKVRCSGFR
jgi:hypothetical protein